MEKVRELGRSHRLGCHVPLWAISVPLPASTMRMPAVRSWTQATSSAISAVRSRTTWFANIMPQLDSIYPCKVNSFLRIQRSVPSLYNEGETKKFHWILITPSSPSIFIHLRDSPVGNWRVMTVVASNGALIHTISAVITVFIVHNHRACPINVHETLKQRLASARIRKCLN